MTRSSGRQGHSLSGRRDERDVAVCLSFLGKDTSCLVVLQENHKDNRILGVPETKTHPVCLSTVLGPPSTISPYNLHPHSPGDDTSSTTPQNPLTQDLIFVQPRAAATCRRQSRAFSALSVFKKCRLCFCGVPKHCFRIYFLGVQTLSKTSACEAACFGNSFVSGHGCWLPYVGLSSCVFFRGRSVDWIQKEGASANHLGGLCLGHPTFRCSPTRSWPTVFLGRGFRPIYQHRFPTHPRH